MGKESTEGYGLPGVQLRKQSPGGSLITSLGLKSRGFLVSQVFLVDTQHTYTPSSAVPGMQKGCFERVTTIISRSGVLWGQQLTQGQCQGKSWGQMCQDPSFVTADDAFL